MKRDRPCQIVLPKWPTLLQTTADGGAVFDANQLFQNVIAVIDQCLTMAGPCATQIAAVASDTFVSNLLGVSTAGEAVTPIFTYADTRNVQDTETLRQELGEAALAESHDRTGCLHTSYLPSRFRWLERTHPDWLRGSVFWLSFGEFLIGSSSVSGLPAIVLPRGPGYLTAIRSPGMKRG